MIFNANINREINQLAESVASKNDTRVVQAACLVYLTEHCLQATAEQCDRNVQPLLELQREWLHGWLLDHCIPYASLSKAMADLQQAGDTAAYLHSLPD